MHTRRIATGIAVAALVLMGCGSGDDGGDPTESTTDAAATDTATDDTATEAAAGATGDVEVFTWWTEGGEKAGLDALVAQFEADNPDATFINGAVAGGAGSNARNVLASRLQTGSPPDTFQGHAGRELQDYIEADQLEPVNDVYEAGGLMDVFPSDIIDLLSQDGNIYSVPANIHRANVVWANPTVLTDNGLSPDAPADMDAWIADLEALQAAGMEAPLSVATEWTQLHLFETVLLAELGAEAYIGLWDGSTDWAGEDVTAALETYATLMSFTNSNRDSLDWPDAIAMVTDGTSAYNVMGDWVAGSLDAQGMTPDEDWIHFPVPGTSGTFDFLSDSFTLPVGAPNPEGAKAWLATVGSPEGQVAFNVAKGSIPVRTDVDTAEFGAYQQSAIADFASDTIVPSLAHGAAAQAAWQGDISSAIGQFSVEGDVATLQGQLVDAAG